MKIPNPRSILGAALLCLLFAPASASAAQSPPSPEEEDLAFIQLGAVGELVTLQLYEEAADLPALGDRERETFDRLAAKGARAWARYNALLGEEALREGDFEVRIPASVLRSRGETLALAARFERLLAGLYLSGVQSTVDPPTRLIVGRHLASATRNLTVLRGLRGPRINLRAPRPLSVEYVGIQFDRYLANPGA